MSAARWKYAAIVVNSLDVLLVVGLLAGVVFGDVSSEWLTLALPASLIACGVQFLALRAQKEADDHETYVQARSEWDARPGGSA